MTQDEIIRMAREAGYDPISETLPHFHGFIERFAALVAAHEREACAKVCDSVDDGMDEFIGAVYCAAAIRARS